MTELNFITATKKDMWDEIKRLESEFALVPASLNDKVNGVEHPTTVCHGVCSDKAAKNLRRPRKNYWEFRKPGSGFGIGGTEILYCPFCGKKLE